MVDRYGCISAASPGGTIYAMAGMPRQPTPAYTSTGVLPRGTAPLAAPTDKFTIIKPTFKTIEIDLTDSPDASSISEVIIITEKCYCLF